MKDTIETIRRSSFRFFSGTLISRITGMLRDISMAYVFGATPSIAAFMVAFRFAHLVRRLFGEGALQSAFVPEFEALRHENEERAFSFFRDLMICLSLFLIFLIAISSALLYSFLSWENLQHSHGEIIWLTLLMLPSLLFICLFGLNASFLQCEKKYFIPSIAPVAFNIIWIMSVFSLQDMPVEQAMPWLSCGVVIACLFQWLLTLPQTLTSMKKILHSFWASLKFNSTDLRYLISPLILGILGVAASQINNAIDSLFARSAEAEGPAFLWYAIRIQQLPLALFGIAIAGAVLPPLSRAIKRQQQQEYHDFLHDALYRTWIFMLPLTAVLFIMGDTVVSLLYRRGDFGAHAVIQTTYCLWAYGIGLIPAALVLILAPACYAQSNYTLPAIASFATMGLNLILNTLFIHLLDWGAVSVALATSISAWVNFIFLGWSLFKLGTPLFSWVLFYKTIPITLSSALALWGTYKIRLLLGHVPFFSQTDFTSSFYTQFSAFFNQAFTFSLLLFFFSFILIWSQKYIHSYVLSPEGVQKR
ncbi:MAG: murein biosynthesis integral membrane protein MurJ [Parachlamydiaceae bacterium]